LWSFVFCGVGYAFGDIMQRMGIGDEETVNFEIRGFMIAFLVIFFSVIGYHIYRASRTKENIDKE
ncbi:MAG TPA: hypothetical protein DCY07_07420, partial [Rhodospirillaceae bacterium]|nr:hypothetical protein [Rhodospirillaceae bacterium]